MVSRVSEISQIRALSVFVISALPKVRHEARVHRSTEARVESQ